MNKRQSLTLDDVLIDNDCRVLAAPAWAFGKRPTKQDKYFLPPIREHWTSLLTKLRHMANERFNERLEDYKAYCARRDAGKLTKLDHWWPREEPKKLQVRPMSVWYRDWPLTCRECGAKFFTKTSTRRELCSQRCASAVRRRKGKERSAKRSIERAEARAGRKCAHCGEPIEAQRATAKFCSDKCRVYAARARKQPGRKVIRNG